MLPSDQPLHHIGLITIADIQAIGERLAVLGNKLPQ